MLEPTSPTTVKSDSHHPTGAGQTCFRQRSRAKLLRVATTRNIAGKSLEQLLRIILIMSHKHAISSTETISNDLHQHFTSAITADGTDSHLT